MPVYEFVCKRCGARFEELLSAEKEPESPCPQCESEEVERRFSPFATEWKPSNVNWHRIS